MFRILKSSISLLKLASVIQHNLKGGKRGLKRQEHKLMTISKGLHRLNLTLEVPPTLIDTIVQNFPKETKLINVKAEKKGKDPRQVVFQWPEVAATTSKEMVTRYGALYETSPQRAASETGFNAIT
ncbi:hypothetical protein NPIL_419201 [Nephila pilipes]|uniref:Uncharacterized protein n=1 Tax=Nephila pilipes TaxID=299642 RepID=A0A8X6NBN6_NEPPI|nr:hypothetical protein NPIL_419201 [Nephila pilipes]